MYPGQGRTAQMRLTAATIRTLSLRSGKSDHVFFDADLPGFGLRATAARQRRANMAPAIRHRGADPPHGARLSRRARSGQGARDRQAFVGASPARARPGPRQDHRSQQGRRNLWRAAAAFPGAPACSPEAAQLRRDRTPPQGARQAAARLFDRGPRAPYDRDPACRDRETQRAGGEQPGPHQPVGVLHLGCT